eukprot:Skav235561  [mRNA]  locus=scaffold3067:362234:364638:+ [translate_table: standard]
MVSMLSSACDPFFSAARSRARCRRNCVFSSSICGATVLASSVTTLSSGVFSSPAFNRPVSLEPGRGVSKFGGDGFAGTAVSAPSVSELPVPPVPAELARTTRPGERRSLELVTFDLSPRGDNFAPFALFA